MASKVLLRLAEPVRWAGAVTLLVVACGGTSDVTRPSEVAPVVVDNSADQGGKAPDCSAEKELDVQWIQTWETGAGAGWYTNNDQCDKCSTAQGDRSDAERYLNCVYVTLTTSKRVNVIDLDKKIAEFGTAYVFSDSSFTCSSEEAARVSKFPLTGEAATLESLADYLLETAVPQLATELAKQEQVLEDCRAACEFSQLPSFYSKPVPAEAILGGARCESRKALHLRTVPLRQFGGNFGHEFASAAPLDGSEWEGVAFWARVGPSGRKTLRVSVATPYTTEKYLNPEFVDADGIQRNPDGSALCSFTTNMDNAAGHACDRFGADLILSSDWQLYQVPFSEMRQSGFGLQAPEFDISQLLGIAFDYRSGAWDIWLDDVGLYRRKQ